MPCELAIVKVHPFLDPEATFDLERVLQAALSSFENRVRMTLIAIATAIRGDPWHPGLFMLGNHCLYHSSNQHQCRTSQVIRLGPRSS